MTAELSNDRVASRIAGFDLARALAIFGMITVNYRASINQVGNPPDWFASLAHQVDGRAAALFVFLAGIGISLLSRKSRLSEDKAERREDRNNLLRRAAFLLVLGFWLRQYWEYDILHFYGVYLIIAALLLGASVRILLAFAALLTFVFPLLYYVLPAQFGIEFWATTNAFTPRDIAIDFFFQGYHPVAPWAAFMLVGMAIGRLDLGDPMVRKKLLLGGVALALMSEALAYVMLDMGVFKIFDGAHDRLDLEGASQLFGTAPYPPMPLFVAVGLGWGMAVVAICLAIGERFAERWWLQPFLHAGQLALTIYIFHGTIGIWAIEWMGYKPHQTLAWILDYSALVYLFCIVAATLWRRRYSRGPVEAIMRRLTDSWKSEINPVAGRLSETS